MTIWNGESTQISRFQERNQHIQELEDALEEEGSKVERAENALLDCQEMLEEIQAFSEHQALQMLLAAKTPRCEARFLASLIQRTSDTMSCMKMMSDFG